MTSIVEAIHVASFESGKDLAMNAWMTQWFDQAAQTRTGGIVRRRIDLVERFGGANALATAIAEAQQRGWHLVEVSDQLILYCNDGSSTIHC